ncbi:MAG: hypothetical protein RIQ54_23, partial [Candidatus Parcubacteria bacterium]
MNRWFFVAFFFFLTPLWCLSASDISFIPASSVVQGDPVLILLSAPPSLVSQVVIQDNRVAFFPYQEHTAVLYGVDIHAPIGIRTVRVTFTDHTVATSTFSIIARDRYQAPLPIPDSLGGNTPDNDSRVVSLLARENAILSRLKTGAKKFWTEPFRYPLASVFVVDPYGYDRTTGRYAIVHKGTDFRASVGTPVFAPNRGVVRVARSFTVYGKTVVIDHGLGVQTFLMHLSRISVVPGQLVRAGQRIGLSGESGYATGPHLH